MEIPPLPDYNVSLMIGRTTGYRLGKSRPILQLFSSVTQRSIYIYLKSLPLLRTVAFSLTKARLRTNRKSHTFHHHVWYLFVGGCVVTAGYLPRMMQHLYLPPCKFIPTQNLHRNSSFYPQIPTNLQ